MPKPTTKPRTRTKYPYPFEWYQYFSKRAHARRESNRLTMAKIRLPLPWYRFMQVVMFLLFIVDVPLWVFAWAFTAAIHDATIMFGFFIGNIVLLIALFMATTFHGAVMKYYPVTRRVRIGNSPELVSDDCHPGRYTTAVDYPMDDSSAPVIVKKVVEVIPYGTVKSTWHSLAPVRGFVVAWCTRTTEKGQPCAGIVKGQVYEIPMKPLPYIAGDIQELRGVDWRQVIESVVDVPVNDRHRIVLGLDAIEPVNWTMPASTETLQLECYTLRQRNIQLQTDRDNQTDADMRHRAMEESNADE